MQDPFKQLSEWYRDPGRDIPRDADSEIIIHQDPVAFAASLIQDHELRLWFEPDWALASLIAERCPACQVFSIEAGAMLVDRLADPPPWRRRRRRPPTT